MAEIATSELTKAHMLTADLSKKDMKFVLKDGSTISICDEDMISIANSIVLNQMVYGQEKIILRTDSNLSKARELHAILTNEKGMPPELRIKYYEEILRLYKTTGQNVDVTMKEDFDKKTKKN